jgi:hypothetical protein
MDFEGNAEIQDLCLRRCMWESGGCSAECFPNGQSSSRSSKSIVRRRISPAIHTKVSILSALTDGSTLSETLAKLKDEPELSPFPASGNKGFARILDKELGLA